ADAKPRGIADGDRIRLRNERGSVVSAARLSDDIMPGTLSLPEGIWFDPGAAGEDLSGSANFLTSTAGTGATSACVMHAIPVEAEKLP
ncbi:MAG: molybdopterin dinucleotide binding domain-containing protein, partial [Rectinemataceae bacterium]